MIQTKCLKVKFIYSYQLASYTLRGDFWKEKGIELVPIAENLVDKVWGDKKPPMP